MPNTLNNAIKLSCIALSIGILLPILPNFALAVQTSFVAGLTGNQEVPPTDTNATGSASFLSSVSDKIIYTVNGTNLTNVTDVAVHIGKEGESGPVVVTLFSPQPPLDEVNGTLSQGNITAADFRGTLIGKQISDLVNLMTSGGSYINIMTLQEPKGEIRGQIGFEGVDESGTTVGQGNITREPVEVD